MELLFHFSKTFPFIYYVDSVNSFIIILNKIFERILL